MKYEDDWYCDPIELDGAASDEYYTSYCSSCCEKTEHDVCTDECVEC